MTTWTYERTKNGYAKMWDSIGIKATDAVSADRFAKKISAGEKPYREVEAATGMPWYYIGALHMRESSCNFAGVLHNGEHIIGTRRKTKLVPAGRGPFKTWVEAAIDALKLKGVEQWRGKWCPALFGWFSEGFNGLGYVGKGINSAYVWAGSNHEQRGKYVADHVWDKNFDDPQIGTLTVMKALGNMRADIAAELAASHVSPMSTKKKVIIGGGLATTVGAGVNEATNGSANTLDSLSPIINIFQNYGTTIGVVFTIAIVVGAVGWHFYEKYQAGPDVATSA